MRRKRRVRQREEKEQKKKLPTIPLRLNILFFVIFLCFSVLILRLGVLQIVHGDEYKAEAEKTNNVTIEKSMPRGEIYDSNYNLLVGNAGYNTITYTRSQNTDSEEILKVAQKLNTLIEVTPDDNLTERNLKDYWIVSHEDESISRLSDKEKNMDGSDQYQAQLKDVTDEDLASLTDNDKKVATLYKKMTNGYAMTEQTVKDEGVTNEEIARVSENLDELPGVDTTMNWDRYYPYEDTLRSILGSVTTEQEGLPADKADYYLSQGYSRNDRVGKSYLEEQYESVLQGKKAEYESVLDADNNVISTVQKKAGSNGKDLVLSIDVEFQKAVEEILQENIKKGKAYAGSDLFDRAFVVAMDPNNGQILALAGQKLNDDGEFEDYSLGTFTTAYNMGSAVKGATELMGMMSDTITTTSTFVDQPIYLKGTPKKSSWFNTDGYNDMTLDPVGALERSSNSYMYQLTMKFAGTTYVPYGPLDAPLSTFDEMRKYYNMFGLGVKTGIDLPGEQIGYQGPDDTIGKILDFAIGQYDSYTPIQLAQYGATIANGGKRIAPTLVKEIRNPSSGGDQLGSVYKESEPKVLNTLDATEDEIKTVQEGFYEVVNGANGTAKGYFDSDDYVAAGKTGTAQAFYDGPKESSNMAEVWNTTFVGYAPADNPEIEIAVVVPWLYRDGYSDSKINLSISKQVFDKYFELKKQHENDQQDSENPTINNKDLAAQEQQKAIQSKANGD
ncbi:peptidoglycan D,D-transpeptidase FtsI family protein [Listeria costaricensis]|uniref:peptidoglycan D,D-transpeptidase FtsI family protein n=1 Tax=Listeria costaricensis TaxID=2026604 RepID=UPI000C075D98|nr:penicillin-binding protein 2 [Listeria costaricensis]